MSVYQSTCERIICSPFVSGITAILSAVYFITYPSLSSAIVTSFIVKGLDVVQKVLRKYDIERFKGFPQSDLAEEEEQPENEDEANDEREEDEEYIPSHKSTLKRRTYNLRNRMD